MKITEKKVVTIIQAEIDFDEFANAYNNLIADVKSDRYFESHVPTKELILKMDTSKITVKDIEDTFRDCHFDLLYNATLRYIAEENGLSIHNYGIYDRFIKAITCSFERGGDHI